jgi:hypothetical protein
VSNGLGKLVAFEAQTAVQAAQIAADAAGTAKTAADRITNPAEERVRQAEIVARHERTALWRVGPWKPRWPELQRLDEAVLELDRRESEITAELQELFPRVPAAEREYPLKLADWQVAGEKGPRPEPEASRLRERIEQLQQDLAAVAIVRERELERRVDYVERHRASLVKDAEAALQAERERYEGAIAELRAAREDLLEARRTLTWAQAFPDESVMLAVPATIAGGRRKPSVAAGLQSALEPGALFELLLADAEYAATVFTNAQAAAVQGKQLVELEGGGVAAWDGTPEAAAQDRATREAAIRYEMLHGDGTSGYSR